MNAVRSNRQRIEADMQMLANRISLLHVIIIKKKKKFHSKYGSGDKGWGILLNWSRQLTQATLYN